MVVGGIVLLAAAGCEHKAEEAKSPPASAPAVAAVPTDKPVPAFQTELLDMAFEAATAIPVMPHIIERSGAQETVFSAGLALDQPMRALGYAAQIANWRRGDCYADFAFYCVQHGFMQNVQKYLDAAAKATRGADQDWQTDHVRVRVAQTQVLLGQMKAAELNTKDLEPSETGKVEATKAAVAAKGSFAEQAAVIDELLKNKNSDIRLNGVAAAAELVNRFYDEKDNREGVEEKIRTVLAKMGQPYIRIEMFLKLSEIARGHKDVAGAQAWVDGAQKAADEAKWPLLEIRLQVMARLARARWLGGDTVRAHADADAVMTLFEKEKDRIQDADRAGAILPLAEAYVAFGDKAAALTVYRRAAEEGAKNVNARPRALDLVAICRSLALSAEEPDAALWGRIRETRAGLGDPW